MHFQASLTFLSVKERGESFHHPDAFLWKHLVDHEDRLAVVLDEEPKVGQLIDVVHQTTFSGIRFVPRRM